MNIESLRSWLKLDNKKDTDGVPSLEGDSSSEKQKILAEISKYNLLIFNPDQAVECYYAILRMEEVYMQIKKKTPSEPVKVFRRRVPTPSGVHDFKTFFVDFSDPGDSQFFLNAYEVLCNKRESQNYTGTRKFLNYLATAQ